MPSLCVMRYRKFVRFFRRADSPFFALRFSLHERASSSSTQPRPADACVMQAEHTHEGCFPLPVLKRRRHSFLMNRQVTKLDSGELRTNIKMIPNWLAQVPISPMQPRHARMAVRIITNQNDFNSAGRCCYHPSTMLLRAPRK